MVQMKPDGPTREAKMLFCGHCNNLLYPESDAERNMLYRCACCRRVESHNDNITVYIQNNVGGQTTRPEEQRLLAEFASDPTAQRDPNKKCVNCSRTDVACFVNPLAQPTEDMTLYFACADCKFVWRNESADSKRR